MWPTREAHAAAIGHNERCSSRTHTHTHTEKKLPNRTRDLFLSFFSSMLPWSSEMRKKEQTSNVSEPLYRAHVHITAEKKKKLSGKNERGGRENMVPTVTVYPLSSIPFGLKRVFHTKAPFAASNREKARTRNRFIKKKKKRIVNRRRMKVLSSKQQQLRTRNEHTSAETTSTSYTKHKATVHQINHNE